MVAAAIEKSFLIRVLKIASPSKGVTKDDCGTDGYDLKKFSSGEPAPIDPDPDSPWCENAWFLLEPADSGLKISQVFASAPQPQSMSLAAKPASTIIGSTLYEIGGVDSSYLPEEAFRTVRSLEIHNQSAGWKICSDFAFNFHDNRAAAFDQFIYLFGPLLDESDWSTYFAYVYDTIAHTGYRIQPPSECRSDPHTGIWAPLEGRGMLVSFPGRFFLHDPYKKEWSVVESYEPLPPPPIDGLTSVLNGILYIFDYDLFNLCAYDCNKGKFLYSVDLPKSCYVDGDNMGYFPSQLVAISDSRFHLMGTFRDYLFVAHVSVSFDPVKATHSAELLRVQCFQKDGVLSVYNCVAVDASLGQMAKNPDALLNRKRDATLSQIAKNPAALLEQKKGNDEVKTEIKISV